MFPIKRFIPGYIWLLFAAFVIIYRALTQSLTIDEAYTYHLFLNQKLAVLFEKYDAAYHVLHTWACWLVVHKFGKSEAVLRLPSMLAGLFYLAGTAVLCQRIITNGRRFLIGVVLLSANPLLADYLSAARGYGAALAFFIWAFNALLSDRLRRASILMGLSVTCNLTFLVPAMSASAVYLACKMRSSKTLMPLLRQLTLPLLAITVPILVIPLSHARTSSFYYGAPDLRTSLNTLIHCSFAHGHTIAPYWAETFIRPALTALGIIIVFGGTIALKQRAFHVVMPIGTLVISIAALIAAHLVLGVLYPWTRTGLYLIWLFLAACLTLWDWSSGKAGSLYRSLTILFGATCIFLTIMFVSQFQTRYYYDFRDDAEVNIAIQYLRDKRPMRTACIGGSWRFEPTVNYYRLRYKLSWLDEMKRTSEPQRGCQLFILAKDDTTFIDRFALRPLWSGPLSGATLAEATK